MEQVASGKLRVLAATGRERITALPDVPTVAEYGNGIAASDFKDFDVSGWLGLLAPAHTPPDAISRLTTLFISALQRPELKPKLIPQGLYPAPICGAPFADQLKKDFDYYGRVIREAKIGAE